MTSVNTQEMGTSVRHDSKTMPTLSQARYLACLYTDVCCAVLNPRVGRLQAQARIGLLGVVDVAMSSSCLAPFTEYVIVAWGPICDVGRQPCGDK